VSASVSSPARSSFRQLPSSRGNQQSAMMMDPMEAAHWGAMRTYVKIFMRSGWKTLFLRMRIDGVVMVLVWAHMGTPLNLHKALIRPPWRFYEEVPILSFWAFALPLHSRYADRNPALCSKPSHTARQRPVCQRGVGPKIPFLVVDAATLYLIPSLCPSTLGLRCYKYV